MNKPIAFVAPGEVMELNLPSWHFAILDRESDAIHNVIAVRLSDHLDPCSSSAGHQLAQRHLTSRMEMRLGVLDQDEGSRWCRQKRDDDR